MKTHSLYPSVSSNAAEAESAGLPHALYRLSLQNSTPLSENQHLVDELVTGALSAPKASTLLAVVGGGWAFRLTRMGVLSSITLPEGSSVLPVLVRGGSYGIALGSESAVFAGIDGGLRRLEGGPSPHGFGKEWAGAAINLGSLKLIMGTAGTQNPVIQHLMADGAMVAGHQLAYRWDLAGEPQGSLAQQMMQAESMNWTLKAGLELFNGFSPQLVGAERSSVLSLRSQERAFSSKKASFSLFPPNSALAEGDPVFLSSALDPTNAARGFRILTMSKLKGSGSNGDGPSKPSPTPEVRISEQTVVPQLIDGRYRVEEFLGAGGQGAVYLATHEGLGRKVAIKVLHPDLSNNPDAVKRFRLEAQAATAIGNPHIVDVIDFGTFPDGSAYFVMEYLNGFPLSKLIEGNRAAPGGLILSVSRQIAEGLSAAHQAGIVHRDLKPDNIFLVNRGSEKDFVKILDFGIAKMAFLEAGGGTKLTQSGIVFGTADYMSPEQGLGLAVDRRSDIYSYGIMLYELATGRLPYVGENPMGTMTKKVTEMPPRFSELNPPHQEIVPGIEAVIFKCLSKEPEDRYQSMKDVIVDLDRLKTGQTSKAESERRARSLKKRLPWVAAGIAGGGLSAWIASLLLSRSSNNATPPPPHDAMPVIDAAGPPVDAPPPSPPPDAPAPPGKKKVTVLVEPADAHIFRGKKDLGAGMVTIEIEEGKTVELEIRRRRFKTQKIILDGSNEEESIALERIVTGGTRPTPPPDNNPPPNNGSNSLENPDWKKKKPKRD